MSDFEESRGRRALSLSKLGARFAFKQGRRLFTQDQASAHAELATLLVKELGSLKGLPMKIGQILSYMDGVVPDEYQEVYRGILAELRTTSRPISADAWRGVFEEELGRTPEEVFEQFDPQPIASASIGQVHRATHRGTAVCVKIQYPGIAAATDSDLKNVESMVVLMRRIMPNLDTARMIADFRDRLVEECDYRQEAVYQQRFAAMYTSDADLTVPGVVDELSTARVLTTRFVAGQTLEAFVDTASEAERNRMGQALFRFAFGSLLSHGLFHADPHPGNLLFGADEEGRLAVLDYGCVQPLDPAARRDIARLLEAAIEGELLREPSQTALGIRDMDEVTAEAVTRVVAEVLAPITSEQPYRFTRTFASDISRSVIEAKQRLGARYLTRRGRFVLEREGVMFVVRNLFGLASIWGTLQCVGDYRAVTQALIRDCRQRPSIASL